MKFIHTYDDSHTPINLKKLSCFRKRKGGVKDYQIRFFYRGDWLDWTFEDELERDKVYENIISLDNLFNVGEMKKRNFNL